MQLTSLLPIALAGLATALPAALQAQTITEDIIWGVSNFTVGCSQGGCVFRYDIAGSPNSMTPKFRTHCSGLAEKEVLCDDNNIKTTVAPAGWSEDGNQKWNVGVTHTWNTVLSDKSLATWFQYGAQNVTVPYRQPVKFVIKPTQEYGIA
ncbi:uncharacterized protein N7500_001539 [Penicillium coprophilum]|uniref:uncharacterized protein n=1 Tax=Penicillium coprophilum TaxID=36646 RepID=UPI002389AB05|nr:uncharacterized protein N7500_001539 [Penicillium coprophilum]KAJ5173608.1 hypothetical protein N7500_001539 [Penicillium coprophilum]